MSNIQEAEIFASVAGVKVESWMLDPVWIDYVGCENCQLNGKKSSCWGQISCHGFFNGCGCKECCEKEEQQRSAEDYFLGEDDGNE